MNSSPSPRRCLPSALVLLAASALAFAGCEQPEHSYSGGYTGNAATVDDSNATVNYDYTLDGPHTTTIVPEKTEVAPGEEISVKVTIKNTGSQSIYAPDKLSQRVSLLSRYADEAPPANAEATAGMLKCHAVAPGGTASMTVK